MGLRILEETPCWLGVKDGTQGKPDMAMLRRVQATHPFVQLTGKPTPGRNLIPKQGNPTQPFGPAKSGSADLEDSPDKSDGGWMSALESTSRGAHPLPPGVVANGSRSLAQSSIKSQADYPSIGRLGTLAKSAFNMRLHLCFGMRWMGGS